MLKKPLLSIYPFLLILLLPGCHRLSFQTEQQRAQKLAKELFCEDIHYPYDGCIKEPLSVPQKLSRDEAIRIALLNNKELQATLYDLGIAKAQLANAVLLENPLLSFTNVSPLNESEINLMQIESQVLNFPDLYLIPLRKKLYSTQLEITLYAFVNKMLDIIVQTRQAYDKALFNQALIDAINQTTATHSVDKATNNKKLEALVDLAIEIKAVAYSRDLMEALTDLRVLLGVDKELFETITLSSTLTEPMSALPPLNDLLQWIDTCHIDMVIAQKKIQHSKELLAYEESRIINRLSVGTTYLRNNDNGNGAFGPYVLAEVPLYHQNQPHQEQARYTIEKQRREYENKRIKLHAALCVAYEKIKLQEKIIALRKQGDLLFPQDPHLKKGISKKAPKSSLKKQLLLKRMRFKLIEAHYELLQLYTAFEKTCGKRIFFAQTTLWRK